MSADPPSLPDVRACDGPHIHADERGEAPPDAKFDEDEVSTMWKELRKGLNKAKITTDANSARFEVRPAG